MKKQYSRIDLVTAFGKQDYVISDNNYRQQLANHPLVRNLWGIGNFFVIVANTHAWRIELVCGDCDKVSGYSADEIESRHAEFVMNFALREDTSFNMLVTKLAMEYLNSRPPEERELIFLVYFTGH